MARGRSACEIASSLGTSLRVERLKSAYNCFGMYLIFGTFEIDDVNDMSLDVDSFSWLEMEFKPISHYTMLERQDVISRRNI
jgi:hypothetical protein